MARLDFVSQQKGVTIHDNVTGLFGIGFLEGKKGLGKKSKISLCLIE